MLLFFTIAVAITSWFWYFLFVHPARSMPNRGLRAPSPTRSVMLNFLVEKL